MFANLLRFVRRLLAWAWYAVVGVVITAAVLLTLARVWLPGADGVRAQLESWASAELSQPVRIGTLDARLVGVTFTLVLEQVELLDENDRSVMARFDETRLELDMLSSLRARRAVVDGLTVVGADLTVVRRADGSFRVQGLGSGEDRPPATERHGGFGAWLLAQRRVALRQSRVSWQDHRSPDGGSHIFGNVDIQLLNEGPRHQLTGTVRLPEPMGRSLNLAVDLTGDIATPGGWDATAYVGATGVEPGTWWPRPWRGVAVREGRVDLNVWARWRTGRLTRVSGETALDGVRLGDGSRTLALRRASTVFRWQAGERGGWQLDRGGRRLERPKHVWGPSRIHLERDAAGRITLLAKYLDLGDVARFARLGRLIDPRQRESLAAWSPSGALKQVRLDTTGEESGFRIQAEFAGFSFSPRGRLPGIQGLDGTLRADSAGGELWLDSTQVRFEAPRLFRKPMRLRRVAGSLAVRRDVAGGWRVTTPALDVETPHIRGRTAARLDVPNEGAPHLELQGDFREGDARAVPDYLPAHIMPPPAVAWLDRAFGAGRITEGGVLSRGTLDRCPFRGHDGELEGRLGVEGGALDYRKGWPGVTDLAAEVVFAGSGVRIDAQSGFIYNTRLRGVTARIPNLRIPVLAIGGRAEGSVADGLRFLRRTPLAKRFGTALAKLDGSGGATTALSIRMPLHPRADTPFALEGGTELEHATVRLVEPGVRFDELQGRIDFTEGRVHVERIEGTAFGRPVRLSSEVVDDGADPFTRVDVQGSGEGAAIAGQLGMPWLAALRGHVPWTVHLQLPHRAGFAGSVLDISSSLEGVAVALPRPFGKEEEESRAAGVRLHLNGSREGQVAFTYGGGLTGVLQFGQAALERGAVHFGESAPGLPKRRELRITGAIEALEMDGWADVFSGGAPGPGPGGGMPALVIDLDALNLIPSADDASAPEPPGRAASTGAALLSRLASMRVDIDAFGYDDLRFSDFMLEAEPMPGGLQFDRIGLGGKALRLGGRGQWYYALGRSRTAFDLHLESDDFGQMIRELGFQTGLSGGRLDADAALTWVGTPLDLSTRRLNGTVKLKAEDGRIDSVEPGAGRLLGLLSVDALPRRLLLDFRDLFERGYRYERIKGGVRLEDGDAYVDNLRIAGRSAGMVIEGRTGLATRDYDQVITVIPNVRDALPVAGGLAWGPQVGAVLLLLRKVFKSELGEIAKYRYRVTGSWDDPKIVRMRTDATDG